MRGHNNDAEDAFRLFQSCQNSLFEVTREAGFNQVRDNLRICSRAEGMTLGGETASQFQMVFDDAVMHHDEVSRAIAMRMSILFACRAVSGPTRMSDAAHRSVRLDRRVLKLFLKPANPANRAHNLRWASIHDGDSTGIISAVFETL